MHTLSNDGKLLTFGIFFSLTAIVIVSLALFALADGTDNDNFVVNAQVANDPPTVYVDAGQSVTGTYSTSATVYIYFNATDVNGAGDLNTSSAVVTLSRTGNTDRTSSGCTASAVNSTTRRYNCSVDLWYYDEPSTAGWIINATITDNSSNTVSNVAVNASLGDIDSVKAVQSTIAFTSSSPGTNDIAASPVQQLNNSGNQDYTSINITGYDLTKGGDTIGASNASVHNESGGAGSSQTLLDGADVVMPNGVLARGEDNLEDVYFWLDIPPSQASGAYSASSNWVMTALQ